MRINFEVFMKNSSSCDELYQFAIGNNTLSDTYVNMWEPEAKAEIRKLRQLPVKEARTRARRWARRNGLE